MPTLYRRIHLDTSPGFALHDITDAVRQAVTDSGIDEGLLVVSSRHTTTAIVVNENETRLLDDIRDCFLRLVPPDTAYKHNDIHLRDCPPDEPENAHAHLIALMLGNAVTLPIHQGEPDLGRWQSILLVELDGPRTRTAGVRVWGEGGDDGSH